MKNRMLWKEFYYNKLKYKETIKECELKIQNKQ